MVRRGSLAQVTDVQVRQNRQLIRSGAKQEGQRRQTKPSILRTGYERKWMSRILLNVG
jgi:hypothetical protein